MKKRRTDFLNRERVSKAIDFLGQLGQNYRNHENNMRASSLAYYTLFSLFPLVLFAVYLGTAVLNAEEVKSVVLSWVNNVFPIGLENIDRILSQSLANRSTIGLVSGVGLLWSASTAFNVLEMGLSVIWGYESRPFLRRRALGAVTVVLMCMLFLSSFVISPVMTWMLVVVGGYGISGLWIRRLVGFLMLVGISFVIYRIFPNDQVHWKAALSGSLISGLTIEIARSTVGYYIDIAFDNFGLIYGSIAWILMLGFWAYLVAVLFFFGAEIAALLEQWELV